MDWFLYDNGLRHERVKALQRSNCRIKNSKGTTAHKGIYDCPEYNVKGANFMPKL